MNDITKPSGFNPQIKAKNPVSVRFVKVKTIGDLDFEDVSKIIIANTWNGWQPMWEEIVEEDTVELDTVTIWEYPEDPERDYHQSTIPIPLDIFPQCKGMSLKQIDLYTKSICERENWRPTYENRMIVLNNLSMELRD